MLARFTYNALLPLAAAAARLTGLFIPKVGEAIAGRNGYRARWLPLKHRLQSRPVWFHVASVGEYEQARPVISAIGRDFPDIPVVLTFSSPSGIKFAARREPVDGSTNVCFVDYLPADFASTMRFCLSTINPRLLVLVKFDLWPNHIWETRRSGIPIVLIDATLSTSSRRLSGPGRLFYRSVYNCIDRILAISEDDAMRFRDTLPSHGQITVAGDTRFDRVVERWQQRSSTRLDFAAGDEPVIIAGSTWPRDEIHLLPALATVLRAHPDVRVIIAPHEPLQAHLTSIKQWARSEGLSLATLGEQAAATTRVWVIDTVGVLAEAYRLGDIAYVGGAFSTGVHSVMEPAIGGLPVIFGPHHHNSFEALQLLERGGAFTADRAEEIAAALEKLLSDEKLLEKSGRAARSYVESQLGATEKCLAAIEEFL